MTKRTFPALLESSPGPDTLKTRRWGGTRLAAMHAVPRHIQHPIGESWEFSTLIGSESWCAGLPLGEVLQRPLPFLAKLIDTALPLSIQVHPDDDQRGGKLGKEEAWVILEAAPDARLLAGVRPGVERGSIESAVRLAENEPDGHLRLEPLMQAIPATPGTVVLIPAGTMHSIGAGVLLAEIQQPTDCTYRLHDYGSGRALQVGDGLAALNPMAVPLLWQPGEAPVRLRGKHLLLDIVGQGIHQRCHGTDQLLVVLGGDCTVQVNGQRHEIPCHGRRLVVGGSDLVLDVPAGGWVVIGSVASAHRS